MVQPPRPFEHPSFNPYAPPAADWVMADERANLGERAWWFEGDVLVVRKGGSLPVEVCMKTGQPADGKPVTRKLQWVHPAVAITVISPIIFLILYLIFRKTGAITYGVSAEFRKRIKTGRILMFAPLLLLPLAFVLPEPALGVGVGMVVWVVCLIVGLLMAQPFRIQKIDKQNIYLLVDPRLRHALR